MLRQTAKLVAIAILFTACREEVDNGQLTELTKRLEYSNLLIGQFNEKTLSDLKEEMWRPYLERADQRAIENGHTVNGLSSWLFNYVESIKGNVTKEKAHELYDRLVRHKQQLLNLIQPVDYMVRSYYDREKKHLFESLTVLDFINDSTSLSTASGYAEKWVKDNFSIGDTLATQTSLLKIKNDILVSEQILLKYFKAKTAVLICGHYQQDVVQYTCRV